ncbi:MAG TPA: hypothetical protein PK111_05055 [Atribacterota bacterium]|nr:hypothetical protein [Atribacterota bacterium]
MKCKRILFYWLFFVLFLTFIAGCVPQADNNFGVECSDCDKEAAQQKLEADRKMLIEYMNGSDNSVDMPKVARTLYTSGENGSTISWGNIKIIHGSATATIDNGELTLNFPEYYKENYLSTLTATLTNECGVECKINFSISTRKENMYFYYFSWYIEGEIWPY